MLKGTQAFKLGKVNTGPFTPNSPLDWTSELTQVGLLPGTRLMLCLLLFEQPVPTRPQSSFLFARSLGFTN